LSKSKKSKKELLLARLKKVDKARSERRLKFQEESIVDGQVAQARRIWDEGNRQQAKRRLETLRASYPKNPRIVETLASFAQEEGDQPRELTLCQALFELVPDQLDVWMYLASAHLKNLHPATARRIFLESLERWPNHEFADGARKSIELAEQMIANMLGDIAKWPESCELAEMHERVLVDLQQERPDRVIESAKQLLERWPRYIPARNNLAEAYFHAGQLELGLQTASETVAMAPEDMFAAASLCRMLTRSGRVAEAVERCQAMAKLPIGSMDHLLAATEACSLLGIHNEVLELIQRGDEYLHIGDRNLRAVLHHWAAVAAANVGQRQRARELWEESLRIDPSNRIVADNLADFRKPSHEQHGAWPFELHSWLLHGVPDRLVELADSAADNDAYRARLRALFEKNPGLITALTLILKHSGPDSCRFVLLMAKANVGGGLAEPLYEFACGQRGSDAFRIEVLNWLSSKQMIAGNTHRMWIRGAWQDLENREFELHRESEYEHSPQVRNLVADSYALLPRDPVRAEQMLRQAAELEPDAPDILFNLAAALEMQGFRSEATAIQQDIQARFPDYFFGQVYQAEEKFRRGDKEGGREILGRLFQRSRFHVSEYAALVGLTIQLDLNEGKLTEARKWLQRLEEVFPDYNQLDALRHLINVCSGQTIPKGRWQTAR
jgi:tetratricopeptide (TPR) repeat protein